MHETCKQFTQYHFCKSGDWSKGCQRGVKYQEPSLSYRFQGGNATLRGKRYFSHMQSYKKRIFSKETSIFIGSTHTCDLNVYCKLFCEAAARYNESYNSAFTQTLLDFDNSQCSTQIIQNKLFHRWNTGEVKTETSLYVCFSVGTTAGQRSFLPIKVSYLIFCPAKPFNSQAVLYLLEEGYEYFLHLWWSIEHTWVLNGSI